MIPPRADHPVHGHFWIPIDDEQCWTWSFDYKVTRPLSPLELQSLREGKGVHAACAPGTFRPLANKDNDYLMDRVAQKRGETYSGIAGFAMQDASVQESMGPIVDRSKENLVATDYGIVMMRNCLRKAVTELRDKGTQPPGRISAHQKVRSVAVVLPSDLNYAEACKDDLTAEYGKMRTTV